MEGNLSKKLDLDLIQMVQNARMLHDASAKPSQIKAVYWIEAKCESCQLPTPRKWVNGYSKFPQKQLMNIGRRLKLRLNPAN